MGLDSWMGQDSQLKPETGLYTDVLLPEPPGLRHAALLRELPGQAMLQPEANAFPAQVSQAPQQDPAPSQVGSTRRAHSHGQASKRRL